MSTLLKGWRLATLAELCFRIVDGSHNPPKSAESGKPMLSARNIVDFSINFDDYRLISDADFELENARTSVAAGDVLLTIVGTIGRTAVVPPRIQEFTLQRSVAVLKPSIINSRYLAYALSAPEIQQWLQVNAKGTAQKGVYLKTLGTLPINVAPENEQARIVTKLEELLSHHDVGVSELKTAQKKLVQYRQSLLKAAVEGALTAEWRQHNKPTETGAQLLERILTERRARWEAKQLAKFKEQGKTPPKDWQKKYSEPVQPDTTDLPELPDGWVWASIDHLLSDIETGKSFKCEERPPYDNEVGVVKVSAVSWGEYNELESKTCHDESKIRPDLFVNKGDFLFSRANTIELVGACVIAKNVIKRVMLSDKILRLILVDDNLKTWLLTLLRSEFGRKYIERLASGNQESMRNIGQDRLKQIPVPVPNLDEIMKASELLSENIQAAKEQEQAIIISLKQSTAQRQNILRAAFAGLLVPQDPNDEPASVLLERIRAERSELIKQPKVRKTKPRKENSAVASKLMDVLKEAADWLPAQEAFRRCGVAEGVETDRIEELYAELRKLDKAGHLLVEAVTDEQGRKLYDKLKLTVG